MAQVNSTPDATMSIEAPADANACNVPPLASHCPIAPATRTVSPAASDFADITQFETVAEPPDGTR